MLSLDEHKHKYVTESPISMKPLNHWFPPYHFKTNSHIQMVCEPQVTLFGPLFQVYVLDMCSTNDL